MQKRDIHIDVISSDIEMPGTMKDFGFAQWARSVRPEVDIVLAGTPERAAHAAGELCEQRPHLMKPYEPKVVLDRIKGLLAARASHGSCTLAKPDDADVLSEPSSRRSL